MHKSTNLFTFVFYLFTFAVSFAQESKVAKIDTIQTTNFNLPNAPQAPTEILSIKNSSGDILMIVSDEGTGGGSIKLNDIGALSPAVNKLYNNGGSLYWNGSELTTGSGGATEINDLSDAKYDGASVFIGASSGANDNGGNHNTAIGKEALMSNISGIHNTASGSGALRNNTEGNANTASGHLSLSSNTTADSNSAFGWQALRSNTTGSFNTAFGSKTLWKNTSGDRNTAVGESALYSNTTGYSNTANGQNSLRANTTGNNNTAVGANSLQANTIGDGNYAGGKDALKLNTTGSSNTAVGNSALRGNTTGSSNIAIGKNSMYSNTTGTQNTANGAYSLQANTTGGWNTAIGRNAMYSNASGEYNTVIGGNANRSNEHGSRNTIIGYEAGRGVGGFLHNKSGNVFLGYRAGHNETGNNKLYINNDSSSSPLIWGDFSNDIIKINGEFLATGSMAVGSNTSASGSNSIALGSFVSTNNLSGSMMLGDSSTTTVLNSSSINRMTMRFDKGYRLYSNTAATIGVFLSSGASSWGSISDSTKKENFQSVDGEELLNKISEFKLTTWNYKTQDPTKFRHYGPMAQDFYSAFGNDGIGTIGNDTLIASADFDGINFIAIQALEKRTMEQESKMQNQLVRIKFQNEIISKIEEENKKYRIENAAITNKNIEDKMQNIKLEKAIIKNTSLENDVAELRLVLNRLLNQQPQINVSSN